MGEKASSELGNICRLSESPPTAVFVVSAFIGRLTRSLDVKSSHSLPLTTREAGEDLPVLKH